KVADTSRGPWAQVDGYGPTAELGSDARAGAARPEQGTHPRHHRGERGPLERGRVRRVVASVGNRDDVLHAEDAGRIERPFRLDEVGRGLGRGPRAVEARTRRAAEPDGSERRLPAHRSIVLSEDEHDRLVHVAGLRLRLSRTGAGLLDTREGAE